MKTKIFHIMSLLLILLAQLVSVPCESAFLPSVAPDPYDFGQVDVDSPVSQTFTITNIAAFDINIGPITIGGPDSAEYNIDSDSCSPAIAAEALCTIVVGFSPTIAGFKNATLDIPTDFGLLNVSLSGTANNPPPPPPSSAVIGYSPVSLDFTAYAGGVDPSALLDIWNDDAGVLNWTVSNTTSWLTLNPTTGIGAGTVNVAVNSSDLPPGVYADTIQITDGGASNSPQGVPVSLTVVRKSWGVETIDTGSVGRYSAMALDPNDKAHASYWEETGDGTGNLLYATNTTGSWTTTIVDNSSSVDVGLYTSIAVDSAGKAHISYYDSVKGDLRYATNVSGAWTTCRVDGDGAAGGADVGAYSSIAVYGGDANISYYDVINSALKYAKGICDAWNITTIDNTGDSGTYSSIAVDQSGKAHISYKYVLAPAWVKYATNASGAWVTADVDSGNPVDFTDIAVDPAGKAHISFRSIGASDSLVYATNTSGSWLSTTIDSDSRGSHSSIAVDGSAKAYISYYDYGNGNLKYATNKSGAWKTMVVDGDNQNSMNVGDYSSIALDTFDNPHITYRNFWEVNSFKYAYYDNVSPAIASKGSSKDGIWVVFSEPMDSSTIDSSTFIIEDAGGPMAGVISYDVPNEKVTFVPNPPGSTLANGTYDVAITSGIKDPAGNAIAASSWTETINEPAIGYSQSSFDYNFALGGANPPAQTFTFSNLGSGSLGNWNIMPMGGSGIWLVTSPANGNDAGPAFSVDVMLTPDFTNWTPAPGTYSYSLVIFAGDANPTSVSLPITLTVSNPTLNIGKAGIGSGTVSSAPAGINCGGDCSEAYAAGTVVVLTATASADSSFAGWSGDADCSEGTVTMSGNVNCTAVFTRVSPGTPSGIAPIQGGRTDVSLTPMLRSSPFSDPDPGDTHQASQWLVSASSDFSSLVYDSGTDVVNKTSIKVPSGKLNFNTWYYWKVRYMDNHGFWSSYSSWESFKTAASDDKIHYFTETANIIFNDKGSLIGFEYPAGYEHINAGALLEGWVVAYNDGGTDYLAVSRNNYSNVTQVSYEVLQNDASFLKAKAVTKTGSGALEITNVLNMNKKEAKASIDMSIRNLNGSTVSSVRIKRVCDLDLDTQGYYGWADYDDYFTLLPNGVRTYTTTPPAGKDSHLLDFYGVPTPDWFGADDWDDYTHRDNSVDFPLETYPVYGDHTATLSWDLGDIPPAGLSNTVAAVYQMAVYETGNASAETSDQAGASRKSFSSHEDVYLKGSKFPAGTAIDVYVVPDRGWSGGETIGSDAGGGMKTLTSDGSGNIGVTKIWASPLIMEKYDVVFDVDRNGAYDYGVDFVIGAGDVGFDVFSSYWVALSAGSGGSISPSTPRSVNHGLTTSVTVTPNSGYSVTMGGTCGGSLSGNVYITNPVTADCTVIATFAKKVYTLSGTVSAGHGTLDCPATADYGTKPSCFIKPSTGYRLDLASGCGAGTLDTSVSPHKYTIDAMTDNCTVTASFSIDSYALTVGKAGTGSGTVTGTGAYAPGSSASVAASADANSAFTGWGGDCTDKSNPATLIMDGAKTCTANFVFSYYSLAINKTGDGTITLNPPGMSCTGTSGGDCYKYNKGQKVTLIASAGKGYIFKGWSSCSGTRPCQVTLDADKGVTASFEAVVPKISISSGGIDLVPGADNYLEFDKVRVGRPKTKTLKIKNSGKGNLIMSALVDGDDAKMFSRKMGSKVTIKPGKSYNIRVTFKPRSADEKSAELVINSNDPDMPSFKIDLGGEGFIKKK